MWYLLGGIGIAGAVALMVYWIKGAISNQVALGEQTSQLELEREHLAAVESAAAAERVARAKELDEKASAVRTTSDAADLLRGQLSRAGQTDHPV